MAVCCVLWLIGSAWFWNLLVLGVSPTRVAARPAFMSYLPKHNLFDMFGCDVGYWFSVLCLSGSLFREYNQ